MVRWVVVGLLALACGCSRARSAADECQLFPIANDEPKYADLSDVRPFRNYLALTYVGPFAHHYLVSEGSERSSMLAAFYDDAGVLQLTGGGYLGQDPGPPPPEARAISQAFERELARRCPDVGFSMRYAGAFRRVAVTSFAPVDLRPGVRRFGWHSEDELITDEALVNTVPVSFDHRNIIVFQGLGRIELPEGARFVELPIESTRGRGLRYTYAHVDLILAAARDHVGGVPAPKIADLPVAEPDSLVEPGYEEHVHLLIHLSSRRTAKQHQARAVLRLGVSNAVFGPEATSSAEVTLGDSRYEVQAKLVPEQPLVPENERATREYRGNLTIVIRDPGGVAFERSYVASGSVITQGREAALPHAWRIPGDRYPSPEYELRQGRLRSRAGEHVGFSIDTALEQREPR